MKKYRLILFYAVLAILTTYSYRLINPGWIAYAKAESLYNKKKYDLAIDFYIKAIDKGGDPVSFSFRLNDSVKKSKDLKKPSILLDLLIARDSTHKDAFNNLADYFMEAENYKQAVKTYNYIIKIDPTDTHARFDLAQVLSRLGQYDRAIEEYEKLLGEDK